MMIVATADRRCTSTVVSLLSRFTFSAIVAAVGLVWIALTAISTNAESENRSPIVHVAFNRPVLNADTGFGTDGSADAGLTDWWGTAGGGSARGSATVSGGQLDADGSEDQLPTWTATTRGRSNGGEQSAPASTVGSSIDSLAGSILGEVQNFAAGIVRRTAATVTEATGSDGDPAEALPSPVGHAPGAIRRPAATAGGPTGLAAEPESRGLLDWLHGLLGGLLGGSGSGTGASNQPGVSNQAGAVTHLSGRLDDLFGMIGQGLTELGSVLRQLGGSNNQPAASPARPTGSSQNSRPEAPDVEELGQRITSVVQNWLAHDGAGGGLPDGGRIEKAASRFSARLSSLVDDFVADVAGRVGGQQGAGSARRVQTEAPDAEELGQRISSVVHDWAGQHSTARRDPSSSEDAEQLTDRIAEPRRTASNTPTRSLPADLTGPGVDELFSSVVDMVSGVVSTVGGRAAGERTHQALSHVADQVETALVRGAALGRDAGATGSGRDGQQPVMAEGRSQLAGHPGRGDRGPVDGAIADARAVLGCGVDRGVRCADPDKTASTVLAALRGRGPPHGTGDHDSDNSRNGSAGDRADRAIAGLTSRITSVVNDFLSELAGTDRAGQSSSGSVSRAGGSGSSSRNAPDLGEQISSLVQDWLAGNGFSNKGPASGGSSDGSGTTASPVQQLVSSILDLVSRFVRSTVSQAGQSQGASEQPGQGGGKQICGVACTAGEPNSSAFQSSLDQRQAPDLLPDGSTDDPYRLASWWGPIDSPTAANQALDDRLAAVKGEQSLTEAQAKVKAGTMTQADYDKAAADHAALVKKADDEAAQLSPYTSGLITDVVSGQRGLAKGQATLDAEKAQVAAGTLDQATYDQHVAAFQEQTRQVNSRTSALAYATGHDPTTGLPNDGSGSTAGCGASGAFTTCTTSAPGQASGWYDRSDQDYCMGLTGVSGCSASSGTGEQTAAASCAVTGGCTTAVVNGTQSATTSCGAGDCNTNSRATEDEASTLCQAKGGCTVTSTTPTSETAGDKSESTGTCVGNCAMDTDTDRRAAYVTCRADAGSCDTNSTGHTHTAPTSSTDLPADKPATAAGDATGAAHCVTKTGECTTSSSATASLVSVEDGYGHTHHSRAEDGPQARAGAQCGQGATGCTGGTNTDTTTNGSHTTALPLTPTPVPDDTNVALGTLNVPKATFVPAGAAGGAVETTEVKRAGSGQTTCTVSGGGCESQSGSDGVSASGASVAVTCEPGQVGCTGNGSSKTSSTGAGDVTVDPLTGKATPAAAKTSTGSSTCTATATDCQAQSNSATRFTEPTVDYTTDKPVVTGGLESTSDASGKVSCPEGSRSCSGAVTSEATGSDAAVDNGRAKSSSGSGDCQVNGGACDAATDSQASSGPGLTLPGQKAAATGPSAISTSQAAVHCTEGANCSGTANSTATSNDPATGQPRTTTGTASCTAGGGACDPQTVSVASTGPGATDYLAGDHPTGKATTGPSAASASGAALRCGQNECTGKVTSSATGTDPNISKDPRGSTGTGDCQGATGGCTAVTNSGASAGPDASTIAPLVDTPSTQNATTTSQQTGTQQQATQSGDTDTPTGGGQSQQQPATPPAGSPGAGANVAPTVPGASSWSNASATLDCQAGTTGCAGSVHSTAVGSDGPKTVNGETGSRGPPSGDASTTATCTNSTECQATSRSTVATGQVVADTIALTNQTAATQAAQQADDAEQAAQQARQIAAAAGATAAQRTATTDAETTAKQARDTATQAADVAAKPVTDAPATWSESSAAGQCTGPGCTATVTGATQGLPGRSNSTATCTATSEGCGATASATALTRAATDKTPAEGEGRTESGVLCPDAGCAAASSKTEAGSSTVTSNSTATCTPGAPCQAGTDGATATDYAETGVTCPDTGCAEASSKTDVAGTATAHATATCAPGTPCQASTNGAAAKDYAQTSAVCAGTGCTTHTDGAATSASKADDTTRGATNKATSTTDCTAAKDGQCAGQSMVGASEQLGARAGASCAASEGSTCSYAYRAESHASASGADADAVGHKEGTTGGGEAATFAMAAGDKTSAQAMASCSGSDGSSCSYHYEATRDAHARDRSTGSFADAHAHGVGGGEMGGGGVAVSATAMAKGNQASASASCTGQANCAGTRFVAEAHDKARGGVAPTWDAPGGYNDATKWGRCSGTNGGCGVMAQAIPGDPSGGRAVCSGDCGNFTQGGSNTFTATVPSLKAQAEARARAQAEAARNSKPIPIDKLGPNQRGVEGVDKDGNRTLKVKPEGGAVQSCTVGVDCQGTNKDSLSTPGGETITYGDNHFNGAVPVTPGSTKQDKVQGSQGISAYRDDKGNGAYSVTGDGSVYDGVSGSTITYHDSRPVPTIGSAPSAPSANNGRFANLEGSPFTTTCAGGCVGDLKSPDIGAGTWSDHVDLAGSPGVLIGRDGVGNAATLDFTGKGEVTTAEKDVIKANGDGIDANRTFITTRDAFGGQGVFNVSDDQTGSIHLAKENYTLVKSKGAGGVPAMLQTYGVKDAANLSATTPDGDGNGGLLGCVGACELTRPDGMKQANPNGLSADDLAKPGANRTCANCVVVEPIAKLGQKPDHTGGITNLADGTVHWTDPYGNTQQCDDKTCHIGMVYGEGGGVTCTGKNCSGTNVVGQTMKGEGWLLYPTTDGHGKITGNEGMACRAGAGKCETNLAADKQLRWQGDPSPSMMLVTDPTYTRPSLNNALDREIANRLGLDPNAALPPLTASDRAALTDDERKRYDASLPPLTQEQKDEAVLMSGVEQSKRQRLLGQLEGELSGTDLQSTLDVIAKANAGGLTDAERAALEPQLTKLEQASATGKELADAHRFVDGIDRATYLPPTIADINAKLAADPGLVDKLAGPTPSANTGPPRSFEQMLLPPTEQPAPQPSDPVTDELAKIGDTPAAKLKRARDNAAKIMGIDPDADPNAPRQPMTAEQAKQSANVTADLSMIPRERAQAAKNAELDRRRPALENGDASQEQIDAFNHDVEAVNAESKALQGIQARINQNTPAPGSDEARKAAQRRSLDLVFAQYSGDQGFYQRLNNANTDLSRVTTLADAMDSSGDRNQVEVAKTLHGFGDATLTRYNAIAGGPRSQDNKLGSGQWVTVQGEQHPVWLNLPSTGRADVVYALNAATRLPTYASDLHVFGDKSLLPIKKTKDGPETSYWDTLSPDEKANIAAYHTAEQWEGPQLSKLDQIKALKTGIKDSDIHSEGDRRKRDEMFAGWFGESRDHPDGWRDWTYYLRGDQKSAAEDAFNDGKPNVVMNALDKLGDGITAVHDFFAYDMPDWTYVGGKAPDRDSWSSKIDDGIVHAVAYAPKGAAHLVGALGVELFNDVKYDPDLGWADAPGRLKDESWAEYQNRVYPFTGMFAKAGQDTWNRWKPVFTDGDWNTVKHGDWHQGLYSGYAEDPVGTLMADLTIPSLPLAGAGAILKIGGAAAKAGALASTGMRAGMLRVAGEAMTWSGRAASLPMQIVAAPYRLWGGVGRLTSAGVGRALPPLAELARSGGGRLTGYATDAAAAGSPGLAGALAGAGRALGGTGRVAEASAPYFSIIGRAGLIGLVKIPRAYATLGIDRDATPAQIRAARMRAQFAADGMDLYAASRTGKVSPAYHQWLADGARATGERAYQTVLRDRAGQVRTEMRLDRVRDVLSRFSADAQQSRRTQLTDAATQARASRSAPTGTNVALGTSNVPKATFVPREGDGPALREGLDGELPAGSTRPVVVHEVAARLSAQLGRTVTADEVAATLRADPGVRVYEYQGQTYARRAPEQVTTSSTEQQAPTSSTSTGDGPAASLPESGGHPGQTPPSHQAAETPPVPGSGHPTPRPADPTDPAPPPGSSVNQRGTGSGDGSGTPPHENRPPSGAQPGEHTPGATSGSQATPPPHGKTESGTDPPSKPTDPHQPDNGKVQTGEPEQWRDTQQQYAHLIDQAMARELLTGRALQTDPTADITALRDLAGRVQRGELSLRDAMPEAVGILSASVRELSGRELTEGQLTTALATARDLRVAELLTGEGKTLAGAVAIVARTALEGRRAQWLTPNQKLAGDAIGEIRTLGRRHGLTVDRITSERTLEGTVAAYRADIVVGPVSEFLFDALRDRNGRPAVQSRGVGFRLIDEIDLVLLDEGLVPHRLALALLGEQRAVADIVWADRMAAQLEAVTRDNAGGHYTPGERPTLTEAGRTWIAQLDGGRDLAVKANRGLDTRIEQALAARRLKALQEQGPRRYLAENGRIEIVDEPSGRRLDGRRWSAGLHEALEYLEFGETGIGHASRTIDSLLIGDFLGGTPFAGMTGTVGGAAGRAELASRYGKDAVHIRPGVLRRDDFTHTYRTIDGAHTDMLGMAMDTHRSGFPVVIAARSIGEARRIAALFDEANAAARARGEAGVDYQMLTAERRYDHTIDGVVAQAGRPGAVTITTNLLTRGIDIRLGGDVRALTDQLMLARHGDLTPGTREYRDARAQATKDATAEVETARAQLNVEGGGLHIYGLGFPRSLRTEMQLRGRSGRHGDYGTSRIFRSLEDEVLVEGQPWEYRRDLTETPGAPLTDVESAAAGALFDLARLEQTPQRPTDSTRFDDAPATVITHDEAPTHSAYLDGVDPAQLAAAVAGTDIPGVTGRQVHDAVNRLTELERSGADPLTLTEAGAEVVTLIPLRTLVQAPITSADLLAIDQLRRAVADEQTRLELEARFTELSGLDHDGMAATLAMAQHLLTTRGEHPFSTGSAAIAPTDRLAVDSLPTRELHALVALLRGTPVEAIARDLGMRPAQVGDLLDRAATRLATSPGRTPAPAELPTRQVSTTTLTTIRHSAALAQRSTWTPHDHLQALRLLGTNVAMGTFNVPIATFVSSGRAVSGAEVGLLRVLAGVGRVEYFAGDAHPLLTRAAAGQLTDAERATLIRTASGYPYVTGGNGVPTRFALLALERAMGEQWRRFATPARPAAPRNRRAFAAALTVGGLALLPATALAYTPSLITTAAVAGAVAVTVSRSRHRPRGPPPGRTDTTGPTRPHTRGARTVSKVLLRAATVVVIGLLAALPLVSASTNVAAAAERPASVQVLSSAAHDQVLPTGTQVRLTTDGTRRFTAAPSDRAIDVATGLGVSFDAFNAANSGRFSDPNQWIGGEPVLAPTHWNGTWYTLSPHLDRDGDKVWDSLWTIYVTRFGDEAGFQRAVATHSTPDLIHPNDQQHIQDAPVTPPTPGQQPPPGTQTPAPTTSTPPPTTSTTPPTTTATPTPTTTTPPTTGTTTPPPNRGPPSTGVGLGELALIVTSLLALAAGIVGLRALLRHSTGIRTFLQRLVSGAGAYRRPHHSRPWTTVLNTWRAQRMASLAARRAAVADWIAGAPDQWRDGVQAINRWRGERVAALRQRWTDSTSRAALVDTVTWLRALPGRVRSGLVRAVRGTWVLHRQARAVAQVAASLRITERRVRRAERAVARADNPATRYELATARQAHDRLTRERTTARRAAQSTATAAGASDRRTTRVLDRATRGVGLGGRRARLSARLGLDTALPARTRALLTSLSRVAIGVGSGLAAVGGAAPLTWFGAGLTAAGVLAGLRARAPPTTTRKARALRALARVRAFSPKTALVLLRSLRSGKGLRAAIGLVLRGGARSTAIRVAVTLAVSFAVGLTSVTVGGWLLGGLTALGALPKFAATTSVLSAMVVSASLTYRYVIRRQLSNQRKGMQTRPRLAAWRSAILAATVTAGYKIVVAFAGGSMPWLFGSIALGGALVAVVNAAVQSKEMGRTRIYKAVVAGALAVPVALLTAFLGGGGELHSLRDWVAALLVSSVVVTGNTPIADYLVAWIGRVAAPAVRRHHDRTARRTDLTEAQQARRLRRIGKALLDYLSFSRVDNRLLPRKALDTVIGAIGSFIVLHAWAPTDSPVGIAVRTIAVIGLMWWSGRVRDWDEHRNGYYGYQSSRALRDPQRPSRLRGPPLRQRERAYRAELAGVLDAFGIDAGAALDRDLAERLAELMLRRLATPLQERPDSWRPITGADRANLALTGERAGRAAWQQRQIEDLAYLVMVIGEDPGALARVARSLRATGTARDAATAEVLEFQLLLGEAMVNTVLGEHGPLAGASRFADWRTPAATRIKAGQQEYEEYLSGPYWALLEAVIAHYRQVDPAHPNAVRARQELLRLRFQLEGMGKLPTHLLDALAARLDLAARAGRDAVDAERAALAEGNPEASQVRLVAQRRFATSLGLLRAAGLLVSEVSLTRSERAVTRDRWTSLIELAISGSTPRATPRSLLEVLFTLAGRHDPVTAEMLAAQFGGSPRTWRAKLTALHGLGALTGDNSAGYRADAALRTLWRAAAPELRHALRANATLLPGGYRLVPLTGASLRTKVATRDPAATKDAYPALLRLLGEADLAMRHYRDGWVDEAGIWQRRAAGLGYRYRHTEGRTSWPLAPDHPGDLAMLWHRTLRAVRETGHAARQRATVPRQHRRELAALVRAARAADRRVDRAWSVAASLAALGVPPADRTALLEEARAQQIAAYLALAQARERAEAALGRTGVDAYPHQIERTLRTANRALAGAPGTDPTPETAARWLRENTHELHAARRALRLGVTEARQRRAALALERYELDLARGWSVKLWRTVGGWRAMDRARHAAALLEAEFPGARASLPVLSLATEVPVLPASPVVPQPGHPDGTHIEPDGGSAVTTLRGFGNRTNEDAGTTLTMPDGSRVVISADGLSSTSGSEWASYIVVSAARTELARTDRPGRTPAQAIQDAYAAAADALTEAYAATHPNPVADPRPYATTLVIGIVTRSGEVTVGWVGDSRAYWLDATSPGDSRLLTADHTVAGIMTHWLAPDFRPELSMRTDRVTGPGLLVATTDGLHGRFDGPAQLAGVFDGHEAARRLPVMAAPLLAAASRDGGGTDDATAAVALFELGALGAGPAAEGGMDDADVDAFARIAPRLEALGRPLGADELPFSGRGPPKVVLDARDPQVRALLAEAGLEDLPRRLLAFGAGGVMFLFAHRVRELAALSHRLPADFWDRLDAHEQRHLDGPWAGHNHDAEVEALFRDLRRARAAITRRGLLTAFGAAVAGAAVGSFVPELTASDQVATTDGMEPGSVEVGAAGMAVPGPPRSPQPDAGAGVHGSAPLSARVLELEELARLAATGAQARGWPHAGGFLHHYLGNTGAPLTVEVDDMLRDIPSFSYDVLKSISDQLRRVAGTGVHDRPIRFAGEWGVEAMTSAITPDWFYAMGTFSYAVTGVATVHPPSRRGERSTVSVDYRVHVRDRYNWDLGGKSVTIGPVEIQDQEMGSLHRAGVAREFDVHGSSATQHYTGPLPRDGEYATLSPTPAPTTAPNLRDIAIPGPAAAILGATLATLGALNLLRTRTHLVSAGYGYSHTQHSRAQQHPVSAAAAYDRPQHSRVQRVQRHSRGLFYAGGVAVGVAAAVNGLAVPVLFVGAAAVLMSRLARRGARAGPIGAGLVVGAGGLPLVLVVVAALLLSRAARLAPVRRMATAVAPWMSFGAGLVAGAVLHGWSAPIAFGLVGVTGLVVLARRWARATTAHVVDRLTAHLGRRVRELGYLLWSGAVIGVLVAAVFMLLK